MPRTPRIVPGGMVFHVLNRGVNGMRLFSRPKDFDAFEDAMMETLRIRPMRMCAYCLMPTHWHMILWPEGDGDIHRFMHRLTVTHAARWQHHRGKVGRGHVYQSRFKSFPVQSDGHFYTAVRYVERNPLRAGLVTRSADWNWSSLRRMERGSSEDRAILSDWPIDRPQRWSSYVDRPQSEAELAGLRRCVARGMPFGNDHWVKEASELMGLKHTLRPRGRPKRDSR